MKTLRRSSIPLRPTNSVFALRVSFPLFILGTALALVQPSAGGTWTSTANLRIARFHHTATLLPDGTVLVAGGEGDNHAYLAVAELYDPASETWTRTANLALGRWNHTATLLTDGKVLVAGGASFNGALADAALYDPAGEPHLDNYREHDRCTLFSYRDLAA